MLCLPSNAPSPWIHLHCYSYDGQDWEEISVLPLR